MNIFVMRHGFTIWNEKGITQGHTQNHLSKIGILESEKVAKEFKDKKIDIIVCSPLKRAFQTAQIMNKYHNVKIIKESRIIDTDQGIFSRRKYNSLTKKEKEAKRKRNKGTKMESYESVINRATNFVNNIKDDYPFENVLIITHNYIATFIEMILSNKEIIINDDQTLKNFKTSQIKYFKLS